MLLSRNSMLWPSLVVVVCGAIFLRLEMRRRRLTLCGRRDQRDSETPDGHTVSSQATAAVAVASSDGTNFRSGGRMAGSGRDMIARRLPASRGQYLFISRRSGIIIFRWKLHVGLRYAPRCFLSREPSTIFGNINVTQRDTD